MNIFPLGRPGRPLLVLCLAILTFHQLSVRASAPADSSLSEKAETLQTQGDFCFAEEDYQAALDYYHGVLQLIQQQTDHPLTGKVLIQLGQCYRRLGDYPQGLEYLKQYLALPGYLTAPSDRPRVMGYLASIYQGIGDYEQSYQYQMQSLELQENAGDSSGIARSLYELGTLFFYQDNFEQSLHFYRRSLELCRRMNNERSLYSCLAAIGSAHGSLGRIDSALHYNLESLTLARQLKMKGGEAYALHNIGVNYLNLPEPDFRLAWDFIRQGLAIRLQSGDKWGLVGSYLYLGILSLRTEANEAAVQYLEKALALAQEMQSVTRQAEVFEQLAEAYHRTGDYPESRSAFIAYGALKDSLLNEKIAEELGVTKTQYEVKKRENQIALLKKEQEIKRLNYNFMLIAAGAVILSLISLLLFYVNWTQKNFSRSLSLKNKEIERQNRELSRMNEDLKRFAYIASHDLKEPLRTIGSFTGLLRRKYQDLLDGEGREFMQYIVDGVKKMNQLLSDILTYSQIENGETVTEWVDTRQVVQEALRNLQHHLEAQGVELNLRPEALPHLPGNPSHLTQLFQNLIANGIKFRSEAPPRLFIGCEPNGSTYHFYVKDNGIGIAPEYHHKIFDMFSRLHHQGQYEGTGIGLATCKKITEKHGGRIWVESEPGRGSTFYVSLPKE